MSSRLRSQEAGLLAPRGDDGGGPVQLPLPDRKGEVAGNSADLATRIGQERLVGQGQQPPPRHPRKHLRLGLPQRPLQPLALLWRRPQPAGGVGRAGHQGADGLLDRAVDVDDAMRSKPSCTPTRPRPRSGTRPSGMKGRPRRRANTRVCSETDPRAPRARRRARAQQCALTRSQPPRERPQHHPPHAAARGPRGTITAEVHDTHARRTHQHEPIDAAHAPSARSLLRRARAAQRAQSRGPRAHPRRAGGGGGSIPCSPRAWTVRRPSGIFTRVSVYPPGGVAQ